MRIRDWSSDVCSSDLNGIKMCRPGARPIGAEPGLVEIRDAVATEVVGDRTGQVTEQDVLADYAAHLLSLAPLQGRRLKLVPDAGHGHIGRAPCRERVCQYVSISVVASSLQKKN